MAAHTDKDETFVEEISRRDPNGQVSNTTSVITSAIKQNAARKVKPIPPPLDLSKRGPLLEEANGHDHYREYACFSASPRSPASANQKHLPFRKRAFSWTTFHDEGMCNTLSPGPSSAVIQRSTYSGFLPTSPHVSRLSVIKQESVDQPDVFEDYPPATQQVENTSNAERNNLPSHNYTKTVIHYPAPQSPAFPTPATPSPLSPMNFPPSSTFFPPHFQPKLSSYSWSGSLLSPAPSLNSSSQEELAQHCHRGSWRFEENEMDKSPGHLTAGAKEEETREDSQPGTSELCERLQRFDFVIPSPKEKDHPPTASNLSPSPAKRPMNGFMLFAQKYRLQLIQQYPGRDNRAISVMLGDAWKSLNPAEKEVYTAEAHMRAEEYRRLFPDCWKRKRFKSTS